jgi:pimeloyl-ACP methyl ester carboxylesterase
MRGGVLRNLIPRDRKDDGLFTFQPFRPGKIPIVLVHGTASSAARWAELVNELQGDPLIREHFQIWLFTYDTGNPIGISAGRLRAAMIEARKEFDPAGKDPALDRMVVMGHSQGGLLTKLTAVNSGTRFWDHLSDKPIDALQVDAKTKDALRSYTMYTPLPFVERVVFIATPHHGALLAGGRLGAIAASLVTLPVNVFGQALQIAATSTLSKDERLVKAISRPPTAVDNMNPDNWALKTLATIPVDSRIKANSIVCVDGRGPKEKGDDGVVAYKSAHIDGVESELVVRSDHSCQGKPETIEEVRRILYEHAGIGGKTRP